MPTYEVVGLRELYLDTPQSWKVALWCASRWARVMVSLRAFVDFGPRILPIFRALWDTGPFFVVMFFTLMASFHSY